MRTVRRARTGKETDPGVLSGIHTLQPGRRFVRLASGCFYPRARNRCQLANPNAYPPGCREEKILR